MTRQERADQINRLCGQHGCNENVRKIHFAQFVDRRWHPHPPRAFVDWWKTQPTEGLDAVRAFNCAFILEEYLESKQIGAT